MAGTVGAMTTTTIEPRGPFSLRESATLGFGHRQDISYDGVLRMAFCVDGYAEQAGVEVRQDRDGVHVTIHGDSDPDAVTGQVARILSLDHDGTGFIEIGRRDPVLGRLQAAAPGLRPPQFHSPYEAAAWSVLSARRPARQMAQVRQRLAEAHGTGFELAGQRWPAFSDAAGATGGRGLPQGVPELKLTRLHAVARAALDGRLDVDRLTSVDPDAAMAGCASCPASAPSTPRWSSSGPAGWRRARRQRGRRGGLDPVAVRLRRPADARADRVAGRSVAALPHLGRRAPPRRRPSARRLIRPARPAPRPRPPRPASRCRPRPR